MKNIDFKKLLVFLGIVIAIGLVIFLIVKAVNKEKGTNEEETKILEEIGLEYITKLTQGYTTDFNGIDLLFDNDSVEYKDLSSASILNTAMRYVVKKELNNNVATSSLEIINEDFEKDISEFSAYNGEAVRQAVKELFGIDYENGESINELGFGYNIFYNSDFDIYLKGTNDQYKAPNYENSVKFYVTKTTKETKKKETRLKMEFVVAYTKENENSAKLDYAKDPNGATIVTSLGEKEEFPKDKVDEFDKYSITLKKVDNNYVFESLKKESKDDVTHLVDTY